MHNKCIVLCTILCDQIGKAGQLDLLTSSGKPSHFMPAFSSHIIESRPGCSVLNSCVAAWLKPPRQMPAVDAILDAVSASYTIGPGRIALIQDTVLYPLCVHAVAHTIGSHADFSSQKQTWYRLRQLGNVNFAVDAVYYSKYVYLEVSYALHGDDLFVVSEAILQIWRRHGLLPYVQRDEANRQEALALIAGN